MVAASVLDMPAPTTRDALLDHAAEQPVSGWDFGWLGDRFVETAPPWDLREVLGNEVGPGDRLLDTGTGGGEWLSGLAGRPRRTVATEAWPPNVGVARARLHPLGIAVVQDEGAEDNTDQLPVSRRGRLPFRDASFDVVINRHEAFLAAEVARLLRSGGRFVTQQADMASDAFHALLGLPAPDVTVFRLDLATSQVEQAGLVVERAEAVEVVQRFADVGALAWYLRMDPWTIPGFDVTRHRNALLAIDSWPVEVPAERFLLVARRPSRGG